ncbi:MAG: hypothetical protein MZV49_09150 [Rhodopseudomonas palustris]|nr:hypothetical protein [Rhodopseudomonas palustris]
MYAIPIAEYSIDGGSSRMRIANDLPDNGSWTWTVPDTSSRNCRLRLITDIWNIEDRSDADFTTAFPKSIQIEELMPGRLWGIGIAHHWVDDDESDRKSEY